MSSKIRVGLLFGGRSCEHEVSVTSARSVLDAIDGAKYEVTMIGISKQGRWFLSDDSRRVLEAGVVAGDDLLPVALDYHPGAGTLIPQQGATNAMPSRRLDVIFPLLHGPYGEDGTVQGLLELADIAYVGSGVVGSAVGMDKEMAKRVFRAEGLPQTDYVAIRRARWREHPNDVLRDVTTHLPYPMFIKPANLGSSVGVTKAHSEEQLRAGIEHASEFDYKLIVEAAIDNAHEIECSVLGNEDPEASVLGEIVPGNEFYDYRTKYIDDKSELIIPAPLSSDITAVVQGLAIKTFRAVEAAGLARVDFFVKRDNGKVFVNEINTIPGFTPISMYPKLWAASGVSYPELIDRLIRLALERHTEKNKTRTAL